MPLPPRHALDIVQVIGLATGGRLGVHMTDRLGIQTSLHTILRRIMALTHRATWERSTD